MGTSRWSTDTDSHVMSLVFHVFINKTGNNQYCIDTEFNVTSFVSITKMGTNQCSTDIDFHVMSLVLSTVQLVLVHQ